MERQDKEKAIPSNFPKEWEQKRVLIAALFLPVSPAKTPANFNNPFLHGTQPSSNHPFTQSFSNILPSDMSSHSFTDNNQLLASDGSNPFLQSSSNSSDARAILQENPNMDRTPSSFIEAVAAAGHKRSIPANTRQTMGSPPPKFSSLIDAKDTEFHASNAGNPGLYNAVTSFKNQMGPVEWIGTSGCSTDHLDDAQKSVLKDRLLQDHSCVPVFVSNSEMEGHYHQFCKQILWKPFHYQLPDYPKPKGFEESAWKNYCLVNKLFAQTIVERYKPGDVVWINDYHLMLVPEMVRKQIPDATIGFFLHIPFPSSEIFRCLSVRKEILLGILGADLIGFQIYAFMRHFLMTCSRLLALDSTPKAILLENSTAAVGSYPIGIDLVSLDKKRKDPEVLQLVDLLKEKYAGRYVVIGRDKNDYVKGVRHKLLAFEKFLETHPEMQGKVVLIQVSLSTSEANESQSNVSNVVSRINSKFGTLEYVPVVYLHQDISFNYYLALLTMADASLITSLRDGMNLTSHEYVVCQEGKKSPLIISEFAGTYGNFGAALRINPWNTQEVADAIYEALVMSDEVKAYRWKNLYSYVTTNTAPQFVRTFLGDLVTRHEENMLAKSTSIPKLSFGMLQSAYNAGGKRIILLDDEGTLQQPASRLRTSEGSEDNSKAVSLLKKLCSDERNAVYLMSSKKRSDLEPLLEKIPNLGISAENGCFLRIPYRAHWETLFNEQDMSWRKKVLEIFQYYTDRTPGSFIEEKEIGIAWHFEFTDMKYGEWQAAECQNHMTVSLPNFPIHILARKKCIEVYLRNVSKATAVRRILQHHENRARRTVSTTDNESPVSAGGVDHFGESFFEEFYDFILCIGDDRSDEYMFQYLRKAPRGRFHSSASQSRPFSEEMSDISIDPTGESPPRKGTANSSAVEDANIFTCTVGSKSSSAKWYISSYLDTLQLLSSLVEQ